MTSTYRQNFKAKFQSAIVRTGKKTGITILTVTYGKFMGHKINHIIQHLPKVGSGIFCFLSGDAADETGEADAAAGVVVVGRLDVDGFENESAAALVDGFLGAVYFDSFDFAALGAEGGG